MPNDRSGVLRPRNIRMSQRNALDAMGVKMDFAMLVARETLEQLGKGTLRAVLAINEG
jgi:hypothetical protein